MTDDISDFLMDSTIRDRALEWLASHEKEILALAGHEPDAQRKSIPRAIIAARLLSNLYTDLRKESNDKVAQSALRASIYIISIFLRLNGENIRMEANPVFRELQALPEEPKPETPKQDDPCICVLDQDGKCDVCWDRLYRFWKAAGQTVQIMGDAGKENRLLCKLCTRRHLDASLANFVTRDLSQVDPVMAEVAMQTMIASSQALQKLPMPLTTMAWNNLVKGKKSP